MIFLILRIAIFLVLIFSIYQLFAYFLRAESNELRCPRCLGKGSWKGVREQEKCDRCNGTGKLLKENNR